MFFCVLQRSFQGIISRISSFMQFVSYFLYITHCNLCNQFLARNSPCIYSTTTSTLCRIDTGSAKEALRIPFTLFFLNTWNLLPFLQYSRSCAHKLYRQVMPDRPSLRQPVKVPSVRPCTISSPHAFNRLFSYSVPLIRLIAETAISIPIPSVQISVVIYIYSQIRH